MISSRGGGSYGGGGRRARSIRRMRDRERAQAAAELHFLQEVPEEDLVAVEMSPEELRKQEQQDREMAAILEVLANTRSENRVE